MDEAQGHKRRRDRRAARRRCLHTLAAVEVEKEEAAVPGVKGHVPRQRVRGCSAQQEAHAAVKGVRMRAGG